jgi:aldose 1-epimerase
MSKLEVVTIKNNNGMELKVTNYGATIIGLKVPDKNNNFIDVVVGLAEGSNYVEKPYTDVMLFLGCTIGRYAGRISGGKFEVDGQSYPLKSTNGVHLHGGIGFDKRYWSVKEIYDNKVIFTYLSKHLEEGYPGNLEVEAIYELAEDNSLKITYNAHTDKSTPVNLTSHPYINLNGSGSVLDHELMINSVQHLDVDSQLLPTGKINDSINTPFDRKMKSKISDFGFKGFDDTFVLEKEAPNATLTSNTNGIHMSVYSNQPAMVVYTPKKFPDLPFKADNHTPDYPAICFEPQNFPDAPNFPHFPDSILKPGRLYNNEIIYQFSIK